jgi:predicted GNAT family acetyltransferase
MSSFVKHLPSQNRFVLEKDGNQVGLTDYTLHGNSMHLTHTEIDPHLRRQGLGDEMVLGVMEQLRTDSGYRVVADCPFVINWLERHPEYLELADRG